ncbi:MAG: penicillin-binding protein 1B, partial [Steroidobacteraceae bacterium]
MARSRAPRWRLPLLIGCIALLAAIAVWVVYLDRVVTREFQGRHWSVPARVFAAPLELYVGAPVAADDLEEELRRLHYRSGDPSAGPGVYRRHGGAFDLQ